MPAHKHRFVDARCKCGAHEAHCEVCAARLGLPVLDADGHVTEDLHLAAPQFCSEAHRREWERRFSNQLTYRDFFGI